MAARAGALMLALLLAAACAPQPVAAAVEQAAERIEAPATGAQVAVAEVVVPAAVGVREIVQDVLPLPVGPVDRAMGGVSPAAVALIVRWEVSSPAYYQARLQGVACPPEASGPTIGIGSDLGHQTAHDIRRDWAEHPMVDVLATASGVVGPEACRAWRAANPGIVVPLDMATRVFEHSVLPRYMAATARAFRDGWDTLPWDAQGGNGSMGFNRGLSMVGERNREKREIRDNCVPRADVRCNAAALRGMKRLWPGLPGLQNRREDEARLVEDAS
jgi:hypothetical protein